MNTANQASKQAASKLGLHNEDVSGYEESENRGPVPLNLNCFQGCSHGCTATFLWHFSAQIQRYKMQPLV